MSTSLRATVSGGIDFESYLSTNAATGEIRTKRNARVVLLTADTLLALADAMHERLGDDVGELLYQAGQAWGRDCFSEFAADAEQPGEVLYHIRNMGLEHFQDRFNDLLVRSGWGTFSIEERFETVLLHVNNSAFHEMVSSNNRSYTGFFSGFLAGFFSELIGVDLSAAQIGGFDEDSEPSMFLLADEAIVAPVRAWVEAGKGPGEVLELLQAGEHNNKPSKKRQR